MHVCASTHVQARTCCAATEIIRGHSPSLFMYLTFAPDDLLLNRKSYNCESAGVLIGGALLTEPWSQ